MTLIQEQKTNKFTHRVKPPKRHCASNPKKCNLAPKHDPIEKLVETVAQSYLSGITKKKSGIVVISKSNGHNMQPIYETLVVLQNNMYVGFPKGTMEPFETFEETAEREFQEETGINAEEMKKRSKLVHVIKGEKTQMFVYLLNDDADRNELKIKPITQDEILHAFWVNVDLLEDMPRTLSSVGELHSKNGVFGVEAKLPFSPRTLSSVGELDKSPNNNYKKSVLTMNVIRELRKLIAKKLL